MNQRFGIEMTSRVGNILSDYTILGGFRPQADFPGPARVAVR
jgi:hypothetical protein